MPKRVTQAVKHTEITSETRRRVSRLERRPSGGNDDSKIPFVDPDNSAPGTLGSYVGTVALLSVGDDWVAFGRDGEDYPRLIIAAWDSPGGDGGGPQMWMGDGTVNPMTAGSLFRAGTDHNATDPTFAQFITLATMTSGVSLVMQDEQFDYFVGGSNVQSAALMKTPLKLNYPYTNGPFLNTFDGDPNGLLPGDVGDWCFSSSTTANQRIWQCTTGGDASVAVWTGRV